MLLLSQQLQGGWRIIEFGSHETAQDLSATPRWIVWWIFKENGDEQEFEAADNNLFFGRSVVYSEVVASNFVVYPRVCIQRVTMRWNTPNTGTRWLHIRPRSPSKSKLRRWTPPNQPRNIVLKCLDDSVNYQTFTEALREDSPTQNRYRRGKDELNDFRMSVKGDVCIRKLFSPCYGDTLENTLSCLEHLGDASYAVMFVSKVWEELIPLNWFGPNLINSSHCSICNGRGSTQIRLFVNQINRIHGGLNQQVHYW